ncbi:MAG: GntR family transcriptional regulator [Kiritimatiellae bacterium]|nr:GntR family transcriptional regulator [Kiritimatiellia bacterium]
MRADSAHIFSGRNAGTTQVERACKAILRTIWVRDMQPGERLPPLRRLAATLGMSNNALMPALDRLAEEGALERRLRSGVFVLNPNAYTGSLWRIAILENIRDMHAACPFESLLVAYIQYELTQAGCLPRIYFHHRQTGRIAEDYPDCVADAKKGTLDGAISLGEFDPKGWDDVAPGMPLSVFFWRPRNSAVIDMDAMRDEAGKTLRARGCRQVARLQKGNATQDFLLQTEDEAPLSVSLDRSSTELDSDFFLRGGRALAKRVLRLPAHRRPDGFIVFDDYIGAGFTQHIRDAGEYRPRVAVLTHVQNPLVFSIPVLRFEVDILALAQAGVAVFMERLRNPALPPRVERIAPRLAPD